MRCGTVAIVGRTNVGKSTFLNACLGERIAIVSPLPQTTRDELLGVLHRPTAQIAFTDTPGFHRPKTELGRRMNQTALDTVRSHEAVVFMTDTSRLVRRPPRPARPPAATAGDPEAFDPLHPDDRRLLKILPPDVPVILVINKVDLLRDKGRLLPFITAFNEAHPFAAIIPTSLLRHEGISQVLDELEAHLPEGDARFDDSTLTDKPATFFAREYIREQVLLSTRREVPHAVAVTVERYDESPKLIRIQATLHVEKAGQRAIIIGQRGEGVKAIGTAARQRLEELLDKHVHLELFVRVTERWKDVPRQLREMGYETGGGRDLSSVLPKLPQRHVTKPKPKAQKKPAKGGQSAPSIGGPPKQGKPKPGKAGVNPRHGKPKPGRSGASQGKPGQGPNRPSKRAKKPKRRTS